VGGLGGIYVEKNGLTTRLAVKPLVLEQKITNENGNIRVTLDSVNSAIKAI